MTRPQSAGGWTFAEWARGQWALWALIAISILIVVGAILFAGASPTATGADLLRTTFGSARAVSGTLREFTPLLLAGLAVLLALRAGLFNIGVEGQFTVGALAAAVIGLKVSGMLGAVIAILGGSAAGALYAWPAAWIKAYRGGHEVITTIMLNSVAALISGGLVAGPLKDPAEQNPTTATLAVDTNVPQLVSIGNLQISAGAAIGIALAVLMYFWLRRSVSGYELQAVGANPNAARFAGVDSRRVILRSMMWSGAIGGLAGAVQVLAFEHRFYPSVSSGYGFDALGVALLAGSSPLLVIPSALLFGALNKGSSAIQVTQGVPKGIVYVILGLLIVIAAAIRYRKAGRARD